MTTAISPQFELHLLGAPRFWAAQQEVTFQRRQPLAIMAVLALHDRAVTRDELSYLLWPDAPQTVARQRLRRSLSQLRQTIGVIADQIVISTSQVHSSLLRFNSEHCRVDAREFLRLSQHVRALPPPQSLSMIAEAATLYRGPLLNGIELEEAPEFEHWLQQQRYHFERLYFDVIVRAIDGYAHIGDLPRALAVAEQALVIDALSEEVHRKIMWLYAKLGQRSSAIRQFALCLDLLERELAVRPDSATVELYQAIVAEQIESARALAFPQPVLAPGKPAHSARTIASLPIPPAPIDEMTTAVQAAFGSAAPVIWVEGPAGAGKSWLARTVPTRLPFARQVWMVSARTVSSHTPFGLMRAVLHTAMLQRLNEAHSPSGIATQLDLWMSEATRVLPELRALFPQLLPVRNQNDEMPAARHAGLARLLQALPRALLALAGGQPTVVIFEDLDEADHLSIEAIRWLGSVCRGTQTVLFITCRTADREPLASVLAELQQQAMVCYWRLPHFDQATVLQYGQAAGLAPEQAHTIWQATGGAPLAVTEMIHAAAGAAAGAALPTSLAEAIQQQLCALDAAERRIMETIAVLASSSIDVIQQMSGRNPAEVEQACARLCLRNWLSQNAAQYTIAHPEIRAVTLASLTPARRQSLHRQAASVLRQMNAELPLIANHLEQAEQINEAAELWLQVARQARSRYAHESALAAVQRGLGLATDLHLLFQLLCEQEDILHEQGRRDEQASALAALDQFCERSPDHPEWHGVFYARRGRYALARNHWPEAIDALRRATAYTLHYDVATLTLLARALWHHQDWSAAEEALQQAQQAAQQQSQPDLLVRYWLARADYEQARERFAAAEEALQRAIQFVDPQSPLLPEIMLLRGNLATVRNDFVTALTYGQEAYQLFDRRGIPDRAAAASVLIARAQARLGQFAEALAAYERAYAGYAALRLRQGMAASRVNAATIALRFGDFASGIRLATEAHTLFQAINDARGMCVAASNIGAALVWQGHGANAEHWLRDSLARAQALQLPVQQAAALANLGAALLQQGRLEEARMTMEQGLTLRAMQGLLDMSIDRAFLAIACLRLGDNAAADMHSAQAVRDLEQAPAVEHPQQIWFARAQVLRALGRYDEAQSALQMAMNDLQREQHQLPPALHDRFLTAFTFNQAILNAHTADIWPDPPALA
ncbi:SARP family transcriptional regulator [Chloroflexus islandicus]|uniref:SARP family transcriptional regulator n=1 Tax=Chloroflexus islandicus TaxID=1707952 RepID=A0A178LRE0_9CHLR|nr:BTAD domain-containing putative transcriptional regulator [Chloroflexus islandicus]OAN36318.1 SARP family transcriptional regulator [Chloroflexus islandicus]